MRSFRLMCDRKIEGEKNVLLCFLFLPALRSVNGTQTSSSREMIQSAFISSTHSSTYQVRRLRWDHIDSWEKRLYLDEMQFDTNYQQVQPEPRTIRLFVSASSLLMTHQCLCFCTETYLFACLVDFFSNCDRYTRLGTVGYTHCHATRFWAPHGETKTIASQTGWNADPAAWEGPGVSTANPS